ncbi:PIN-like domain-containing protein [Wohlfahrtiimonas chitiniclastica]|uniref:PIN-like domain-containing protein n=1 Tax=Wohlfahrtiimonas chitiniclastica TaxID=400946 RepID=UPI0007B69800|nr:PIN-like domain-containing protein [Wohlfahrtiimonas chitiniclastica]KZX36883.1 hypothetical protein A6V30_07150 [Wohlfahrtiimonas chitiniclastica]
MKNKFSHFYNTPHIDDTKLKQIWKSEDTIFIFDTNTLLDLYRYRKETQNEFFKQLENIKSNIWMPYHVGLEFHNNRLKVIKQNKDKNKEIDSLKDLFNIDLKKLSTFQDKYKKADHPDLYEKIEELKNTLKVKKEEADTLIKSAKEQMKEILSTDSKLEPHFLTHKDKIVEKLSNLFTQDKIGDNLYNSQEKIDSLFNTAKQRWAYELPPGYLDYNEKKDKCFFYGNLKYYSALGDLIIFKEIINISSNKKNILFISNDVKSDWKMNIDYEGKKDLGVRPELRSELMDQHKHILYFEILTTEQFIEKANFITGDTPDKEVMQDVKHSRNKLFYDEQLPIWINKHISDTQTSSIQQQDVLFNSPKPHIHKEQTQDLNKMLRKFQQQIDFIYKEIGILENELQDCTINIELLALNHRATQHLTEYDKDLMRLELENKKESIQQTIALKHQQCISLDRKISSIIQNYNTFNNN